MKLNKDEKKYYGANLLYQCRCDWSDAKQVRNNCEMAKDYLTPRYANAIDEHYITCAISDGRQTRDGFPNYLNIHSKVKFENLTEEFKKMIEKDFIWHLNLKRKEQ